MKKKNILTVAFWGAFFGILLASCSAGKSTEISGKIDRLCETDTVILKELGTQNVDTCITKGDDFSFVRRLEHPSFFTLHYRNQAITLLANPGDHIEIFAKAQDLIQSYKVEGSEDSQHIEVLSKRLRQTYNVADSLNNLLKLFQENKNYVNIYQQFEWIYMAEVDSLREFNIRFLDEHGESLASLFALYQQVQPGLYLFNREEDLPLFQKADTFFYKLYPEVPYVKSLHLNVAQMNEQSRLLSLNRLLGMLDKPAPDFNLSDLNGEKVSLKSFQDKILLLGFWASWSGESRLEHAHLRQLYELFKDKPFEILQISIDKNPESWAAAVAQDSLIWRHANDPKDWKSELLKEYNVEKLPAFFLIDTLGNVLAKDLKGKALEVRLSEIFNATK